MNKYIISYIEKVPLWRTILGVANIVFTIFNLVTSGNIATIVPLAFSYLLLKTEGTEIDLESKTYRKVFSILGFKIGKWQPIPDIDYVSVFAATFKTTVWASSASANISENKFAINLFYNTKNKIEATTVYQEKEAFDIGLHLADALDADLLDATETGDFKWMNKDAYREKGEFVYE
tara:strand:- start:1066 stop:1596 length:531 start_codon:yes stop_codon:yes gene_type:complete